MIAPVFVDTNVLVYARDSTVPAKQRLAADWLRHLWRERSGRISVQVLSEYYVTVTRKLRPGLSARVAWEDIEQLFTWTPQPIDAPLLERARALELRQPLNWWDAMIVAAAEAQGCNTLLSEDLQDGASYGQVTVRNPFKHAVRDVVREQQGVYEVLLAVPRHRPRCRPVSPLRVLPARRSRRPAVAGAGD